MSPLYLNLELADSARLRQQAPGISCPAPLAIDETTGMCYQAGFIMGAGDPQASAAGSSPTEPQESPQQN